jgi:transcriptional regulator with XRE-family HTH domain
VDAKEEMREFLISRRAKLTPQEVGLPSPGGRRRVSGLRREEVALCAGISVEYYTRLERGSTKGVSDGVLDAVARTLRLDEAERLHLYHLARAVGPSGAARRRTTAERVRPTVQRILDAMGEAPAYVRNGRLDILAANRLGEALYRDVFDDQARPANMGRFAFLDPRAKAFFADWDQIADDVVAVLHAEAGRDPFDKRLSDLVGELSTRSEEFRRRWATHDVKLHRTGRKTLHHPVVGDLTLDYEAFELAGDPGQRLNVYTPEPGSPSQDALALLASWIATPTDTAT